MQAGVREYSHAPFVQLEPFEKDQIVGCYEDGHFKELMRVNMIHWWCFNAGNRSQMDIPSAIEQILESYIVQALIKNSAL